MLPSLAKCVLHLAQVRLCEFENVHNFTASPWFPPHLAQVEVLPFHCRMPYFYIIQVLSSELFGSVLKALWQVHGFLHTLPRWKYSHFIAVCYISISSVFSSCVLHLAQVLYEFELVLHSVQSAVILNSVRIKYFNHHAVSPHQNEQKRGYFLHEIGYFISSYVYKFYCYVSVFILP